MTRAMVVFLRWAQRLVVPGVVVGLVAALAILGDGDRVEAATFLLFGLAVGGVLARVRADPGSDRSRSDPQPGSSRSTRAVLHFSAWTRRIVVPVVVVAVFGVLAVLGGEDRVGAAAFLLLGLAGGGVLARVGTGSRRRRLDPAASRLDPAASLAAISVLAIGQGVAWLVWCWPPRGVISVMPPVVLGVEGAALAAASVWISGRQDPR